MRTYNTIKNQMHKGLQKGFAITLLLFPLAFLPSAANASWFGDNFTDSSDGYLDMSQWLASKHGFLPVPIIITEPAIGNGGGIALTYFHGQFTAKQASNGITRRIPPSISSIAGGKTTNGTYFIGGGHLGIWQEDNIRYTGFAGNASINLEYSGLGDHEFEQSPLSFNLNSLFLLQKLMFRVKESNFFLGGQYFLMDSESKFEIHIDKLPGFPEFESSSKAAALGFLASYDSRDNIFYPQQGTVAEFKGMAYDPAFGGEEDFNSYRAKLINFSKPHPRLILGLRVDANAISGDAPFYYYPFINMRGIPAMRYQGKKTLLGEAELNWLYSARWNFQIFGGAGKAYNDYRDSDTVQTVGTGLRYNLASKLGLHLGFDVVSGPEENAFYIQIGSGLMR